MSWPVTLKLHELSRGPVRLKLEPDEAQRAQIANQLGLRSLPAFTANIAAKPWLDGAELTGRFDAVVEQVCGVSLDPFEQPVRGDIEVRAVPRGSEHAAPPEGGELDLDLESPDPPDELEGDTIDVSHYVVEHLALEIDPFPRKPGATFDYQPPEEELSPFAVLKKLTEPKA
ncbi:MAG: DUF177 domain-containing protein [Alphaproteobacteria bacterium]|nr:DUF177 domain-containing protein [Alphaproteobacteria bacterium]MBU1513658.1 DUF177 domain-containing protein [Alphaproteobacteria bacterium]MBU2094697.1 DUF177 domain-containing protein [Alphaproteobacteria bacterium]MBU2150234.1 DUF177 domain-containing protein [Alphaproteobacteria bacterium]MBU2309237.1 DUF177 domain-containing protein [Alphaproteobacteria bacterium]